MSNLLLEKGVLSVDTSVINPGLEEINKVITEKEAFRKLIRDNRSLHFCLILVHIVLIFGVNAHFLPFLKDLKNETKICILVNPMNYALFLAFAMIILVTSVLSIRHSSRKNFSLWFLENIRKAYYINSLLSIGMIGAYFWSSSSCKVKPYLSGWQIAWALVAFVETIILIVYLNWLIQELRELGFLTDAELSGVEDSIDEESAAKKKKTEMQTNDSFVLDELPSDTFRNTQGRSGKPSQVNYDMCDISMASTTTV